MHADTALQLERTREDLRLPRGQGDGTHMGPCPLAGMRAPELAAGFLEPIFEDVANSFLFQLRKSQMDFTDDAWD